MGQNFQPGDYLIFQIESGYGLLRILAIDEISNQSIWHLQAFNEMFLDIEMADAALADAENLTVSIPHVALTNRAFEATQVARMKNEPLAENDLTGLDKWQQQPNREVSDRSIRLMLGLR